MESWGIWLGLILFSGGLFVFGAALVFHNKVTHSTAINYSKRIAAETAALLLRFYDPFTARYKRAVLGPEETVNDSEGIWLTDQEEIDCFLKANPAVADEIESLSVSNSPIRKGRFPFYYEPWDSEMLDRLRKEYQLDEVVRPGQDEFAKMVLLREWLHQRWQYGETKNVDFNFNALDILERARRGEVFFCSEYATTFVQAAVSLGWTARYLGIERHVVAEIWSNQWKKWVLMDPTYNVHYELGGTPQNALELHRLWFSGKSSEVQAVRGPSGITNGAPGDPDKLIKKYVEIYVRMRNDWFSNRLPHWHPVSNSIMNGVVWVDGGSPDNILISQKTSDPQDLYWELNTVGIALQIDEANSGRTFLKFETVTPNFSHLLLRTGGKEKEWKESRFTWHLRPGQNRLEVVPVNAFGLPGSTSQVSVNYEATQQVESQGQWQ
jgi:hypothetical protein